MLRALYHVALCLVGGIFFLKSLWQYVFLGKYRKSLFYRLGWKQPLTNILTNHSKIWIHAVSVGEVKALSALIPMIKKAYPHALIIISTTTETGLQQAKESFKDTDCFCYLPIDFPWVIRSFVKAIRPDLFLLCESDFWLNLLEALKKEGASLILVNGKISDRSFKRFYFFKFLSKRLFSLFDFLCVQEKRHVDLFLKLGVDGKILEVTGNLKFDDAPCLPDVNHLNQLKKSWGISQEDQVVTIGSTHKGEEEPLLDVLLPYFDKNPLLKVLIVPRHPERFSKVEAFLKKQPVSYFKTSDLHLSQKKARLILVDQMGILSMCYMLSYFCVVGGSFIKGIGGHDIFEPIKRGIPVVFGPYMDQQKELVQRVLDGQAGIQTFLEDFPQVIHSLFYQKGYREELIKRGEILTTQATGSSKRTFDVIQRFFPKVHSS